MQHYDKTKKIISFTPYLTDADIEQMAIKSGFQVRTPKKILPSVLVKLLLEQVVKLSPSYNDIASNMEKHTGISVSRQAISRRVNDSCVRFVELILAKLISTKISSAQLQTERVGDAFQRILVQDSTVIRLPARLFGDFSGVANAHAAVCNARIQSVYDLKSGQYISFSIDPYSTNDLTAAPALKLQAGDLVLRDRGYLTTSEVKRHLDAGADCIYRHKHKVCYLDPQTKMPIDLAFMLKQYGHLDCTVLLNNEQQTPVRLVAAPVSEEIANLRRMKAKMNQRGHAPSKVNLALMSWSIFITTIDEHQASFDNLLAIYGLRWRIESIFKTWKSNMNFAVIHNVSKHQLRTIITLRLSMLVIISHHILTPLRHRIFADYGKHLSMMKLMRYLQVNPECINPLIRLFTPLYRTNQSLLDAMARYCVYDSRKKRLNYTQIEEQLFILLTVNP